MSDLLKSTVVSPAWTAVFPKGQLAYPQTLRAP